MSGTGRFTGKDPFKGDGLNLYVYVKSNPMRFVDPSGYCVAEGQVHEGERVYGFGFGASGHGIIGVDTSRGIYWDEQGNVALLKSKSLTTISDVEVSINFYIETATNISIKDLSGISTVYGAGGELPVAPIFGVNHEKSISIQDTDVLSSSTMFSANLGFSPVEVHTGVSDTDIKILINYQTWEGEIHDSILWKDFVIKFDLNNKNLEFRWK
jgi:hypothetical protein